MMRFAICDDMPTFLIQLDKMIHGIYPDEQIEIDEFTSGEDFLAAFSAGKYDAVILDVQMKKLTGIQAAHEVRKTDHDVVIAFHTSFEQLDFENYSVGAYIHMKKGQPFEQYKKQFTQIYNSYIEKKATARLGDRDIPIHSILYFQGHWGGTYVHTDTETLDLSVKLSEIEKNEQIIHFVIAHKKYYINSMAIRFVRDNGVSLINGEVVPLAGKYKDKVTKAYVDRLLDII